MNIITLWLMASSDRFPVDVDVERIYGAGRGHYGITDFVPKTFRSQERKVPMENLHSGGTKVPGKFR